MAPQSAPSVPPSVQTASSALESSLESFLSRQRRKRMQKQAEGRHELLVSSTEEQSLKEAERAATRAARHGSYILECLALKRQALSLGVAALDDCTDQCLAALEQDTAWCDNDRLQDILGHFFTNYLRLRDGLVLLTSGECRHPDDCRQAAMGAPEFKSSFGTDSTTRGDGYTALFRAKGGYSGFGWDEFYDENVGVRTRLVDSCLRYAGAKPVPSKGWGGNRAKVWNRLRELGAEVFESEFDVHDTETKVTKAQLETSCKKFLDGVNSILFKKAKVGKLTLVTTDKFERMELQNAVALGISSLVIERQGDNFCIIDGGGVLPTGWDEKSWKKSMELRNEWRLSRKESKKANSARPAKPRQSSKTSSASLRKKRRVIIEYSDSDNDKEDCDAAKERNMSTNQVETTCAVARACVAAPSLAPDNQFESELRRGLKVKVKSIDDASSSPLKGDINQIKSSLGVDAEALARGCEELDAEQKRSASAAAAEDAATSTGINPDSLMNAAVLQDEEALSMIEELLENIAQGREEMKAMQRVVSKSKAEDVCK